MADREKVLNALENCTAHQKCRDCRWEECEYEHETVEIPLTLAKDALSLLKAQDAGWISVKDRLPEKNTPVLWYVVLKDRGMGHCRLGTFDGAVNHEVPSVSCCGPNAIPKFWMPLPKPPKEET